MPTLQCVNPSCRKPVPLPEDTPAGKVYGCPHCRQPLPPAPARGPAPAARVATTSFNPDGLSIAVFALAVATWVFPGVPFVWGLALPSGAAAFTLGAFAVIRHWRADRGLAIVLAVVTAVAVLVALSTAFRINSLSEALAKF